MKKKSLVMLLCAIMIVTSAAFGTIAYLTDRDSIKNTFTVGNVDIVVDETDVDANGDPIYPDGTTFDPDGNPFDPDGNPVKPNRTTEDNEYPLVPGDVLLKDPTLTVKAGSKESYVRMVVTINKASELKTIFDQLQIMYPGDFVNGFLPEEHVEGWNSTTWPCTSMLRDPGTNTIRLEFRYCDTVVADDTVDTVLPALFTGIKVPGKITYEQLNTLDGLVIEVEGHAIQKTTFDNADDAWLAFGEQVDAVAKLPSAPAQP